MTEARIYVWRGGHEYSVYVQSDMRETMVVIDTESMPGSPVTDLAWGDLTPGEQAMAEAAVCARWEDLYG